MLSAVQTVTALGSLLRHPRASRDRIASFQNQRLRRLIHHAYESVPYYRRLFDRHSVRPGQIRTIEDLALVPVTSRKELQDLPVEEIVTRGVDPARLIPSRSSGSSGRPLTVRRSWLEERLHNAYRWRALRSYGLRSIDVHAYVMLARPYRAEDNRMLHRVAQAVGLGRYVVVSCFQSPGDIVTELRKIRPDVVSGYASALAELAQQVDPVELRSLRLRFVGTGGEVLTPRMRESIEQGFGAPVYDTYASIEFNILAWQCRQTGDLHTCDDGVVMEILDGTRPVMEGEEGEVVGTDLHAYAMPMIRYRLGDVVTRGSLACPCGQPFSTIRSVQGRTIDYFHLPDGRAMHPYELGMIHYPWIRAFQVTQERLDRIVMRLVPGSEQSAREIGMLKQSVAAKVGPGVEVEVEVAATIPVDPSGKFRPFRSLLCASEGGVPEDNRKGWSA
jgi:phenylacetate-CoA ligase